MNIKGVLTHYSSKRDVYGNVYHAATLDLGTDKRAVGTGHIPNLDTQDCREVLHWHVERHEIPIREYNRLTKDWPYVGCGWEEIKGNLLKQLGK